MTITIDEIALYLEKNQIRHTIQEKHNVILTFFETEKYFNPEEEHHTQILIMLEKTGRSIQFIVPHCYSASNTINKTPLYEAILNINWESRIVQYRYDIKDNEIRAGFSYPLEDSKPTETQIVTSIFILIGTLNKYHHMIQSAIDSKPISFPENEKERVSDILDSLFVEQNVKINPNKPMLSSKPSSNEDDDSSEDSDVWL